MIGGLPYLLIVSAAANVLGFGAAAPAGVQSFSVVSEVYGFDATRVTIGLCLGIAFGIALAGVTGSLLFGSATGFTLGALVGITSGTLFGLAPAIGGRVVTGLMECVVLGLAFAIAVEFAFRFAGTALGVLATGIYLTSLIVLVDFAVQVVTDSREYVVAGVVLGLLFGAGVGIAYGLFAGQAIRCSVGVGLGVASALAIGLAVNNTVGASFGIASVVSTLRLYYHPVHPLFLWPRPRASWYSCHPVAWDDLCAVPFVGLDRLLIAYAEREPEAAAGEVERIIARYPSQKRTALRARVVLRIREARHTKDLSELAHLAQALAPADDKSRENLLPLKEAINGIARAHVQFKSAFLPVLREQVARLVRERIQRVSLLATMLREPAASEFRAAAERWLNTADELIDAAAQRTEIPQIFEAGKPVDREKEAFVPRLSVIHELERQIASDTGCPGLVLYGRRRMGKSTVLNNLSPYLPPSVCTVVISMQNPEVFGSMAAFIEHLGGRLTTCFREWSLPALPHDLPGLFRLLRFCNSQLAEQSMRLLIALDEYENIDEKIRQRAFSEDCLATIRESIQYHPCITWLLAGSHEITDLTAAPWTSYLVGAQTVEVPPFARDETYLLLTDPLGESGRGTDSGDARPRVDPEFWGTDGIDRIHNEAGGWPHLIQLIAATAVNVVNDMNCQCIDAHLMEEVLDKSILTGHITLYQLLHGETKLPGEWKYLSRFRACDRQDPPSDEAVAQSLRRRLLVVEDAGQWRLRVPLMLRWLRKRG